MTDPFWMNIVTKSLGHDYIVCARPARPYLD